MNCLRKKLGFCVDNITTEAKELGFFVDSITTEANLSWVFMTFSFGRLMVAITPRVPISRSILPIIKLAISTATLSMHISETVTASLTSNSGKLAIEPANQLHHETFNHVLIYRLRCQSFNRPFQNTRPAMLFPALF